MLSAGAATAGLRAPVATGFLSATKEARIGSRVRRCAPRCARTTAVVPRAQALEFAVTAEYGLDFDAIVRLLYRDPADRQLLTRLARAVMALSDDPVMAGILDAGCDYLVALANVLRRQLRTAPRGETTCRSPCTAASSATLMFVADSSRLPGRRPRPAPRSSAPSTSRSRHHRRSDHGTARSTLMTGAGELMAREIAEQPAVFDRILEHGRAISARWRRRSLLRESGSSCSRRAARAITLPSTPSTSSRSFSACRLGLPHRRR